MSLVAKGAPTAALTASKALTAARFSKAARIGMAFGIFGFSVIAVVGVYYIVRSIQDSDSDARDTERQRRVPPHRVDSSPRPDSAYEMNDVGPPSSRSSAREALTKNEGLRNRLTNVGAPDRENLTNQLMDIRPKRNAALNEEPQSPVSAVAEPQSSTSVQTPTVETTLESVRSAQPPPESTIFNEESGKGYPTPEQTPRRSPGSLSCGLDPSSEHCDDEDSTQYILDSADSGTTSGLGQNVLGVTDHESVQGDANVPITEDVTTQGLESSDAHGEDSSLPSEPMGDPLTSPEHNGSTLGDADVPSVSPAPESASLTSEQRAASAPNEQLADESNVERDAELTSVATPGASTSRPVLSHLVTMSSSTERRASNSLASPSVFVAAPSPPTSPTAYFTPPLSPTSPTEYFTPPLSPTSPTEYLTPPESPTLPPNGGNRGVVLHFNAPEIPIASIIN